MKKIISRIFLSLNILLVILMILASGIMLFVKNNNPPTAFGTSFYIIENSVEDGKVSVLVGVKKQSYNKAGDMLLIGDEKLASLKKVEKAEGENIYLADEKEPITVNDSQYIGTVTFRNEFWGKVFAFASNEQNFSLILLIIGAAFIFLLIILVLTFALTSRKYVDENDNLDNEHQQIEMLKLMQDGTGEIPLATEEKRDSPFQDPLRARGFANSLSYIAKEEPSQPDENESISVEELINEAFSEPKEEEPVIPQQKEADIPLQEEHIPQPIEKIHVEPDYSKLYQKEVEGQTKVYVLKKDRNGVDENGVKLYVKPEKKQEPISDTVPAEAVEKPIEEISSNIEVSSEETELSSIYSMLDDIEENFKRTFEDDDE